MIETSKCPFCNSVEDSMHVQSCLATTPSANRRKVLQSLPKKLDRLKTAPYIKVAILKILAKTWKEIPVSKYGLDTKSVLKMESAQEEVGLPENIITGKWCFKWQQEQERFFCLMKNKKSPRRWQAAVIKLIWDTAWDFWQFQNEEAGKQNTNIRTILEK